MTAENPRPRRRWRRVLVVALALLTCGALLSYRRSIQTARAYEVALELQHMGGHVYFPPSLRDVIREYWRSGRFSWHPETTVLLGNEIDGEWLRNHRYLEDVSVSRLDFSSDNVDAAAIATLIDIHSINSIGCIGTTGTDAIAEALATESMLRAVYFYDSDLTDAGFRRLPLEQLEMLEISDTLVTGSELNALRQCERLETLSISRIQFTEEVARTLAGLPRLERLYVHGKTTDDVVPLLGKCQNLQFLHITSSSLTNGGIESLNAALPGCVIEITVPANVREWPPWPGSQASQ